MIRNFLIFSLIVLAAACNGTARTQACATIDVAGVNRENVIRQGHVTIVQTRRAIHDTLAPDLLLAIKDRGGKGIAGIKVPLSTGQSEVSDQDGNVSFISFAASNKIVDITFEKDDSGCFKLIGLPFTSGEIRGFDLILDPP